MNLNVPQLDQYTFTVTTTAGKAASFAGPFQVINGSTTATIWLADNSIVSDGHGVPLYPGTGMEWTGGQNTQELWAVLGTDTASQTAASVPLFIGSSVRDWQANPIAIATAVLNSGVIMVDNPVRLVATANPAGFTSGFFDVSTFNTLVISTVPAGVAGTNRLFTILWFDVAGGTQIAQDQWGWAIGDTNLVRVSVPIRGASMQYIVSGDVGNTQSVVLTGSRRPHTNMMNVPADRFLGTVGGAPGVGASITLTPIRYDGPILYTVKVGDKYTFEIDDSVQACPLIMDRQDGIAGGVFHGQSYRFSNPRNTTLATLTNIGAGAASMQISAYASPEGF